MLRVLHNTREVDAITAPCIVGQAALLEWLTNDRQVRPASLRAATNCYLWRLSLEDLVVRGVMDCYTGIDRALHC